MTRETIETLAGALRHQINLFPEDWQAIADQAERILTAIQTLDELPLQGVEPTTTYHLQPAPARGDA